MREWTYRFALPLVLVALVPALVGLKLNGDQQARLKRDEVANCRQVEKLKMIQRADINRRIAQSLAFTPTKDIPKALIAQSIRNMAQTRRELAPRHC